MTEGLVAWTSGQKSLCAVVKTGKKMYENQS